MNGPVEIDHYYKELIWAFEAGELEMGGLIEAGEASPREAIVVEEVEPEEEWA